ncbi:MAG: ribosome biogenesis GTPase Der [Nitrospirae bacterium]|nr:ribosome biogenesis GTPase Der [Nitrospirota bacterium]
MKKTAIAIVGRPNVGKSTLFNRIVGRRTAIVENLAGITRDRNYADASWEGRGFILIDTGGVVPEASTDAMTSEIRRQALLAIEEADVILHMVDGRDGVMPDDIEIANLLRASAKPVIHVVNKVDGPRQEDAATEFYALAPDELFMLSALHGRGLDDILDRIIDFAQETEHEEAAADMPRIAVVGKPNSGKSTLVNALIGKDRLITSPVAGTTRDSIDTECRYHGKPYLLIDTAGLRKKSRIEESVEYYSVVRTVKSIERADIALILIDAVEGFTEQDQKVAGIVHEAGKGVIFLVNKWDIAERSDDALLDFTKTIRNSAFFLAHAPVLSISALTRQRITKVFPLIDEIMAQRRKRIPTARLNEFVARLTAEQAPPLLNGKIVKIQYMTQVETAPPSFSIFANKPQGITPAYIRFVERKLREEFGFAGTPIRLFLKKRA